MAERPRPGSVARSPRGALATSLLAAASLGACADEPPEALGTLEYDRITLPSPAAEPIVSISVREGEHVAAGPELLSLEEARTRSEAQAALAEARRQSEALAELEAGPRAEDIAQARARLRAAEAEERDAHRYYERVRALGAEGAVAAAEVDRARASAEASSARVRETRAALTELLRGTRREQIAQAEAAAAAAAERAAAERVTLTKLGVVAPRAGIVDSLPYRLGDQAPVGAPLAVLLVGDAPYARVYVPEPIRARVHVGQRARVFVDGVDGPLEGRVRMIRSEPSFTPYYALTGEDAARLSYLAEVQLRGPRAESLPAGLPARVRFVTEEDAT